MGQLRLIVPDQTKTPSWHHGGVPFRVVFRLAEIDDLAAIERRLHPENIVLCNAARL